VRVLPQNLLIAYVSGEKHAQFLYLIIQNLKNLYWKIKLCVCTNDVCGVLYKDSLSQALFSFKKYMPSPLPYFKVNICPLPLPHFASIFFAYLWSFRWPNYIVTLPRYFSFRLTHLNIATGPPSDELDKNIQRTSFGLLFSHWNGYSHFLSGLNWFRK
jgi:hypothetical protein